jgi:hypothetical protein
MYLHNYSEKFKTTIFEVSERENIDETILKKELLCFFLIFGDKFI